MDRSWPSSRPPVRRAGTSVTTCLVVAGVVSAGMAGLAGLTGCSSSPGPKTYPVNGKVTFAGAPVERGTILFRALSADGRGYSGEIAAGAYALPVEAGEMRVEITASRVVPGKFTEANPGEREPVYEMFVPEKYNTASTLRATVAPGTRTFAFDLLP
jgi:hypothetical protein